MSLPPGTRIVANDGSIECEVGDFLGMGREGTVYEVIASSTGLSDIVIKIIDGNRSSSQVLHHIEQLLTLETKRFFYQTPSLECVLSTPFISHDDKCCLLMPRAKGEVLETDDAWREVSQLPLNQKLYLAHQIAQGIKTIHQAGRIHADIAGPNIIIDKNQLRSFIIDIDGGGIVNEVPARVMGHPSWMAPELELGGLPLDSTLETDCWSLAVLLHYIIVGCSPFFFCDKIRDYALYEQNWPPNPHSFDWSKVTDKRKVSVIRKWLPWQHKKLEQIGDLADLFRRCFGPGQRNPKIRPTTIEWEQALSLRLGNKLLFNKLCPRCGHENQWNLVYCDNCAAVLHQALISCSRCGRFKPINASFCPECGAGE